VDAATGCGGSQAHTHEGRVSWSFVGLKQLVQ
jgi:hypothetical protein